MKIDNNPFAKGFREGGDGVFRSKKRKAEQQAKEDESKKLQLTQAIALFKITALLQSPSKTVYVFHMPKKW